MRPPSLGEHPAHVSVVGCYHYSVVSGRTPGWASVQARERWVMHSDGTPSTTGGGRWTYSSSQASRR